MASERMSENGRSPMKILLMLFLFAFASLSSAELPAQASISNLPPSNITDAGAYANGFLSSTGNSPVTVRLYWGASDGGTDASSWENTNTWSVGEWGQGTYPSTNVYGFQPETGAFYTFAAVNEAGTNWATPSTNFTTGIVSVGAQDVVGAEGISYVYSTSAVDIAYVKGSDSCQYRTDQSSLWNYYRSNCLVWLSFSESNSASVIYDTSTNGNGGTVYSPGGTYNRHTNSAYLLSQSTENRIRLDKVGILDGAEAWTVAMWIASPVTLGANFFLIRNYTNSTLPDSYYQHIDGMYMGKTRAAGNTSWYIVNARWNPDANQSYGNGIGIAKTLTGGVSNWHRLVLTYIKRGSQWTSPADATGGLLRWYVDGELAATSSTYYNIFFESYYWWIGGDPQGSSAIIQDIYVDDVVIDASCWDAAKISSDFSLQRSSFPVFK